MKMAHMQKMWAM